MGVYIFCNTLIVKGSSLIYFCPLTTADNSLQINQAILGSRGLDVQFIGINFLESLVMICFYCFWHYMYTICVLIISSSQVSEFSPSTSSAMGLPREFHENCRKSLEQNFLKVIVGLHLLPDNPLSFFCG